MKHYLRGATAGLGVGLLLGWSLGVSGLIPDRGWPPWAISAIGIALIFVGLSDVRAMLRFGATSGVRSEPSSALDQRSM